MKSKNIILILSFVISLLVIANVSAEITFSQLKPLYNLGDQLTDDIKITSLTPGYLDINLICAGGEENLYHNVPESNTISIKRTLIPVYIGNMSGDCTLSASYGDESGTSASFKISNVVQVTLQTGQNLYDAGSNIIIRGKAVKENGANLGVGSSAIIELNINGKKESSDIVKDGSFNINYTIPETTHAGNYSLEVRVYDKDSQDNILNTGDISQQIQVNQKPAKIQIALDNTTLVPGNELRIIPFLYDMAGDYMNYSIMLQIKDSADSILFEGIVNSNEEFILNTTTNTTAGNIRITAQKDAIIGEKNAQVLELKKVIIEIKNQTLTITNIGNVPYNQVMQFQIGNETVMKDVSLALNETRDYDVSAPSGVYDVSIKDDSSDIFSASGISITGDVISIQEAGTRINNFIAEYPIVWLFLILVVLGLLFAWYKKYQSTRFLGPFHEKRNLVTFKGRGGVALVEPKKEKIEVDDEKSEKLESVKFKENKGYKKVETVRMKDVKTNKPVEKINIRGDIRKGEQALILHGPKQQTGVIAIKLKNGRPNGIAKDNLMNALEEAYALKGVSYIYGDYVLVIFSPLVTKTHDNEDRAIKAAQAIEKSLIEHNKRFKEVMTFGIGVNSGQLINKIEDNILKFVSIEKTIILAKKIADISNGEVLISKDIHLKTANSVKTDKVTVGDLEIFKIKRIVDTQAGEKFIKEFLRRN